MRPAFAAGLAGMRQNLKPGIVLWVVGAAILAGYWLWPAARPAYDTAARWKSDGGYGFSAISGGLCGGVVPFLFLWATGRIAAGRIAVTALFLTIFWIYRGIEVDAFYRFQAVLFGTGTDAATVAKKTLFDMAVYAAFWANPTTLLAYFWFFDSGGDWRRFRAGLSRELFTVRLPALVMSAWAVWGPTVCIVYSLPPSLQMPVFCIVLCFWVLLVSAVTAPRGE
jgi:hypothetical protein